MLKKFGAVGTFLVSMTILAGTRAWSQDLKAGPWRFELKANHAVVPFIVDFKWNKRKLTGNLHNGKETIELKDIIMTRKELKIPLQTYEMTLELTLESPTLLTGFLVRHNKNPLVKTPVTAAHGVAERYPGSRPPATVQLGGRWAVKLTEEDDKESQGVVMFEQKDNHLTGSVLTPTGDYRYFEGFVSGDEFEASSFDGVFNYLFKGKAKDGKLEASLLSNSKTKIEGIRNDKAELPDAFQQTQVTGLSFSYPDLAGRPVSLNDKKFKGKAVVVQIYGSWCPNCMDEVNFLIPWYKENKRRGVEVIALAFERSLSADEAKRQLNKTVKKKGIPYAVLLVGHTSEDKPMDKIKGLTNFISFPTTIFLNRKHEVVKVHAGFTGPSTGEFYEKWKNDFNQTVAEALK